nr:MAG TPA: hypothetical protein [Caudoviricetes sp.]
MVSTKLSKTRLTRQKTNKRGRRGTTCLLRPRKLLHSP